MISPVSRVQHFHIQTNHMRQLTAPYTRRNHTTSVYTREVLIMKRTALSFLPLIILLFVSSCGDKPALPGGAAGLEGEGSPSASIPPEANPIAFVRIPGGMYRMGDVENMGRWYEKPTHLVTLSGFEMSASEITNTQYAKYLTAALANGVVKASRKNVIGAKGEFAGKAYIHLEGTIEYEYPGNRCWITFDDGKFSVEEGKGNWPVTYVTWYGAWAFARFYGYDLPTEQEWEYACRGGKEYMYGTDDGTISTKKANYNEINAHPVDVRSYPQNPYGLYDMSGNVGEWCRDWFDSYMPNDPQFMLGVPPNTYRVIRGGTWNLFSFHCRAAYRNFDLPYGAADYLGFRVVRRPSGR